VSCGRDSLNGVSGKMSHALAAGGVGVLFPAQHQGRNGQQALHKLQIGFAVLHHVVIKKFMKKEGRFYSEKALLQFILIARFPGILLWHSTGL
jgi:hypothetical protein